MKRPVIKKSKRFEILFRDRFRCRYCGAKAPDTRIEVFKREGAENVSSFWDDPISENGWNTYQVDHIIPVAQGGSNDDANLVTCCWDCNAGKGARGILAPHAMERTRDGGLRPIGDLVDLPLEALALEMS